MRSASAFRDLLSGSVLTSRVAQFGRRQFVKSIQRGVIVINGAGSATASITAVDINNAYAIYLGCSDGGAAASIPQINHAISLTNTTTVTASVGNAYAINQNVSFEVIEYWPGVIRSIQRGTVAFTVNAQTQSITAVDTTRSTCFYSGNSNNSGVGLQSDTLQMTLDLNTATAVRFLHANIAGTWNVPWTVVEYY